MILPAIVNRAVDGYVTPEGIAAVLRRPEAEGDSGGLKPALWRGDFAWVDLDHFRATYADTAHPDQRLSMLIERRGVFSWKVTRLNLPLDEITNATRRDTAPREVAPPQTVQTPSDEILPSAVGQCAETSVLDVETRLENTPGSGSAIKYANGGYQVSYDQVPAIDSSQPGDRIQLCLASVPQNCPPGDDRGKVYHAVNRRTGDEWDAPDSEHSCGGA